MRPLNSCFWNKDHNVKLNIAYIYSTKKWRYYFKDFEDCSDELIILDIDIGYLFMAYSGLSKLKTQKPSIKLDELCFSLTTEIKAMIALYTISTESNPTTTHCIRKFLDLV